MRDEALRSWHMATACALTALQLMFGITRSTVLSCYRISPY